MWNLIILQFIDQRLFYFYYLCYGKFSMCRSPICKGLFCLDALAIIFHIFKETFDSLL